MLKDGLNQTDPTNTIIMKKILILIATLAMLAGNAYSRNFRFGAEAGFDLSKPSDTEGGTYPAYHFAVNGEYDFISPSKGLYIAAKVQLADKSWSNKFRMPAYNNVKEIAHPGYLQIPVLAGYRLPVSDDISFKIEAGPYAGVGLFGSSKINIYNGMAKPYKYKEQDCFGADGAYRRFDAGIAAGIGISICGHWDLTLNTAIQLNSFDPASDKSNRTFGLSVAYLF